MRYCKVRSCDNFKGVRDHSVHMFGQVEFGTKKVVYSCNNFQNYSDSLPNDANVRSKWEMALADQECSSSQWICIHHFTPEDYTVSNNGKRYKLKPSAVPSVFDVYLIEVNEEEEDEGINNQVDELQILRWENKRLHETVEKLTRKQTSEKMFLKSRIAHMNATKSKQCKQIDSLKKQVSNLEKDLAKASETIESYTSNAQVNINSFLVTYMNGNI